VSDQDQWARGRSGADARLARLIAQVGAAPEGVRHIDDSAEMSGIMREIAARTRLEALTTLPGGPYSLDYLRSSWDEDVAVMRRGVKIRALYQADAARAPEVLRYLVEFAAEGAEVRVSPRVRHRCLITDRSTVVVAAEQDSLGVPFLVIDEPALVSSLYSQFVAQWKLSHPVGVRPDDPSSLNGPLVRETLEMLQSGATDEMAARHLGVSVRTVRRRVATVMDLLGAASRFEAGVKAAQAGWL